MQKAPVKVPSKTQTAWKPIGKRPLEDSAQSVMPPPASANRARHPVLQVSTSASNTSVGANVSTKMATPDVAQAQEVSSSSEAETQPAKKEIMMTELNGAAAKEYSNIQAVMNSPLIKKIHEVLRQEVLNKLSVHYRFGGINPLVWKITEKQFRPELSPNEAHSYAYLMQNKEFEVSKKEVQAKVKDLRANGYYSDTLMLFENFSTNLDAVRNTICYIHRCEGFEELVLEIQGIELAHRYAKAFRAYCKAVVGQLPLLLEYGLTQESQFLLRNELSAQLSTTISF